MPTLVTKLASSARAMLIDADAVGKIVDAELTNGLPIKCSDQV
jgi:hypothetical protein